MVVEVLGEDTERKGSAMTSTLRRAIALVVLGVLRIVGVSSGDVVTVVVGGEEA